MLHPFPFLLLCLFLLFHSETQVWWLEVQRPFEMKRKLQRPHLWIRQFWERRSLVWGWRNSEGEGHVWGCWQRESAIDRDLKSSWNCSTTPRCFPKSSYYVGKKLPYLLWDPFWVISQHPQCHPACPTMDEHANTWDPGSWIDCALTNVHSVFSFLYSKRWLVFLAGGLFFNLVWNVRWRTIFETSGCLLNKISFESIHCRPNVLLALKDVCLSPNISLTTPRTSFKTQHRHTLFYKAPLTGPGRIQVFFCVFKVPLASTQAPPLGD